MNLKSQADGALKTFAPFLQGRQLLDETVAGQRLQCDLVALDALACAFDRFELQSAALASAAMAELKPLSENLSRRLTYLLEPISPMEADAEQCVVQLRSNPPQKDEDATSYYELLVARGGRLSLCRWLKERGQPRRKIPAQVTREVFLRLVADFSAAAG
jgi:hypothetical protein